MVLVSLKERLKYSNMGDECAEKTEEGSNKEDNKSNKQMQCYQTD